MSDPLVPRYKRGEDEYIEALRISKEMAKVARATGALTRLEQVRLAVLLAAFSGSIETDHEFTHEIPSRPRMGQSAP
jgi:hypothetical protein